MQIVIDIPDILMEYIVKGRDLSEEQNDEMAYAITDGIPLPKGHGRLIDADTLEGHSQIQIVPCSNGKYVEVMTYYQNDIDVAPTIIEAEKEDKE